MVTVTCWCSILETANRLSLAALGLSRCALLSAALLTCTLLVGCGYKAPLFMPKPKAETPKRGTLITPEPAPDRPVPAEAAPAPK